MTVKRIDLMDGHSLPLKQFDLKDIADCPTILMLAKRGSGKSWVVRAIINHFKKIPMGMIISPTDEMSAFYGTFYPDTYIHYQYKPEMIEKLLARQQKIIEKAKHYAKHGKKIDTRVMLIMDDCLANKSAWAKDEHLKIIFLNGRHYKITYIVTMQDPLGLDPSARNNIDYIFLLADDKISNLKKIYDHYAGIFPTFQSFRQVFVQLTEDFGTMVITNRGANQEFLNKVFWYKAPDLSNTNVTIGNNQFNKFHSKNYNKNWRNVKKQFNFDDYVLNKKQSKAIIKVDKVD